MAPMDSAWEGRTVQVLIVEPDADLMGLLVTVLADDGQAVTGVPTGEAALATYGVTPGTCWW
jgi:hypothetical protein